MNAAVQISTIYQGTPGRFVTYVKSPGKNYETLGTTRRSEDLMETLAGSFIKIGTSIVLPFSATNKKLIIGNDRLISSIVK
jgi:hypothetical protein